MQRGRRWRWECGGVKLQMNMRRFIALIAHTSRVRASNRSCRCCRSCGQSTRNAAGAGRLQLNVADTCIVVDVHVISWDEVASCTLQVALGLNARPARHSPIKRRRCGGTQRCRCRRAAAHQNFLIFAPRHRALPLATSCNDVQFVF